MIHLDLTNKQARKVLAALYKAPQLDSDTVEVYEKLAAKLNQALSSGYGRNRENRQARLYKQ